MAAQRALAVSVQMLQLPPAEGLGDGPVPDLHVFCNEEPMSGVRNAVCSSQWNLDMHPSRVELLPSRESNFCCWYHHLLVLFDALRPRLKLGARGGPGLEGTAAAPGFMSESLLHLPPPRTLQLAKTVATNSGHKQWPQTVATDSGRKQSHKQWPNSRHK